MTEWHPQKIDWSKETRCTPCRMPSTLGGIKETLKYTPVACSDCKFGRLFHCIDCGEWICFCEKSNNPPLSNISKKKKCLWHEKRI